MRHSSTPKEVFVEMWQTIKAGKIFQGTYQNRKKDGSAYWVEATIAPVIGADGKPEKYVGIRFDVTAAKEAVIAVNNLLKEAQQQSEELRAQEEEIRQNLEEMQATNEEVNRQGIEMRGISKALDKSLATIEFDLEGNVMTANENFLHVMQYTLDEVVGKPHRMFVEADYARSNEYVKFWDDLRLGKEQIGEVKRLNKNGEDVWLSASYTPVFNNEGKPYKVIKFAQDLTQKKKEALDTQCKLNAIDRAYGVIEFDTNGNVLYANENFLELMGYGLLEIQGRHHRMFVQESEHHTDEYRLFWERLGKKGEFIDGEFKRVTKKGEIVWLKATYNAVLDPNGKPYKVIKYAQDITQVKNLEMASQQQTEELRAQEEELRQNMEEMQAVQETIESKQREVIAIAHKYEQILEGCADAVVMINGKGIISFFNASAESLWGYDRADVMGKNVKMLMDTDHSKKHDSYLSNYHKTGVAKVIGSGRNVDALRTDGTKVPILLTLSEAKISETESVYTAFIKDLRIS